MGETTVSREWKARSLPVSRPEWMLLLSIHHSIPLKQIKGCSRIEIFYRKECHHGNHLHSLRSLYTLMHVVVINKWNVNFGWYNSKTGKGKAMSLQKKNIFISGFLWIRIYFPSLDRKKQYDKGKFSLVEMLRFISFANQVSPTR